MSVARWSIQSKLIALALFPALIALVVGAALVGIEDRRRLRADLMKNQSLIARVAGDYAALALAFDDPVEAETALRPVTELDGMRDVLLFDQAGELFYGWHVGPVPRHRRVPSLGSMIRAGLVQTSVPVIFDGRPRGTMVLVASTAAVDEEINRRLLTLALLVLGLSALALALGAGLQGYISRPLVALAGVARRVSREGDLTLRVEPRGDDELADLYRGFNAMLEEIEGRQAELERRQAELMRSNRDLDQFAYVASHDLKAPLRAIATLSTWIEEDLAADAGDQTREQLALLRSRVGRMDRLIDGLLQYSRVGREDLPVERVEVTSVVEQAVELLSPPPEVEISIGPDLPTLSARRLRLQQVFINLIGNAIKHADRDGVKIEIRAEDVGDGCWQLSVSDDGPGIDPKHHERIFRMFQTLDVGKHSESTGLGLALVAKIVEEEGGEMWLESALGEGATFYTLWLEQSASIGQSTAPMPAA
ncbi:MAG: ATP-binding protein [Acidobacteriota bacterium]